MISNKNNNPVITLLSDLGKKNINIPVVKAELLSTAVSYSIVDISHTIEKEYIVQAAYLLQSAYNNFPVGTIHILLVSIFSEKNPKLILAEKNGYYFIAPDNGILTLAFNEEIEYIKLYCEIQKPFIISDWIIKVKEIVEIILFSNRNDKIYNSSKFKQDKYSLKKLKGLFQPNIKKNEIECSIMYIDRYGNVVLNINKPFFSKLFEDKPFTIFVAQKSPITSVSINYNDVPKNEPLCRFNDTGLLELAINHGDMAAHQNINIESTNQKELHYRRIYIRY